MLDLSLIIVNWNTRQMLRDCLNAVQQTAKQVSHEIIVVDNGSTDGSQDMVRTDYPEVCLIANSTNVGFARANNQALRHSRGRYVLLLNSDCCVRPGTLDQMVEFMDAHPEAGLASCKLRYTDNRLQYSCYSFPTLFTEWCIATHLDTIFPRSRLFGKYRMTYWNFNEVRQVDAILGAFMLARATAIEQVGPLDESFFMYSEEVDWCYRFRKKGWKVLFNPAVEAVHVWGGSSRQVKVDMLIHLYRSRTLFFRKHYGRLSAHLFKWIIGLNCLLRIGPGALLYRRSRDADGRHKPEAFGQLLRALPSF